MRTLTLALAFSAVAASQDTTSDPEVVSALKELANRGFTYEIRPAADVPNFASARDELAGAVIRGECDGGMFHAKDGMFEIYSKKDKVAVRTESGWLSYDEFITPMRLAIQQGFENQVGGSGEYGVYGRRGNVTKGREALEKMIRLDHLVQRSDLDRLSNIATAFKGIKRTGTPEINGKASILFEGNLTESSATALLQGPFNELARQGNAAFSNVTGIGRLWVQDGVVRRMHARSGGNYAFFNEDDNVQRKGVCTLDLKVEITKVGETKVEPPAEALKLLE